LIPAEPLEFARVDGATVRASGNPRQLGSAFYVAPFTVQAKAITAGQWAAVMGSMPSGHRSTMAAPRWTVRGRVLRFDPNQPLTSIGHSEVIAYLARLNSSSKLRAMRYDLPTEHELELLLRNRSGIDGTWLLEDGHIISDLMRTHRARVDGTIPGSLAEEDLVTLDMSAGKLSLPGDPTVGVLRLVLREER
jgi:hypothetical protein